MKINFNLQRVNIWKPSMGLFPTEVTRNSGNFEILSRNFSILPWCSFNEYFSTAWDTYVKSKI